MKLRLLAIASVFALLGGGLGPSLVADEAAAPPAALAAGPTSTPAGGEAVAKSEVPPSGELAPIPAKAADQNGVALSKLGASTPVSAADESEESAAADMVAELRRRRDEADAREKALNAREAELRARESVLDAELKKLQSIRDDIAAVEESRKKENDSRVAKIVETVESMSPKAAAPLLAAMDEALAVAAMGKVSTPKLAKIMNVMEPRKSARLSELLAGVVRAKAEARAPAHIASNGAVDHDVKSTRGGEQDDGHSQ